MKRRKSSATSYRLYQYGDRCSWMRNSKFLRELENDNVDSEIVSEELRCIQDDEQPSCRGKTTRFLESNPWLVVMCALVLLDTCVVISEILLELNAMRIPADYGRDTGGRRAAGQYREAATDLQHAVRLLREIYSTQLVPHQQKQQQTASSSIDAGTEDHSVIDAVGNLIDTVALIGDELAERTQIETGEHSAVPVRLGVNVSAGNKSRGSPPSVGVVGKHRYSHADDLFQVAHIFHLCSIVILGVFVVEMLVKAYAAGKKFIRKKMEVFDAVIIVASFTLDLIFVEGITGVQGEEALALIIIFLLWRVLRVINGLMVAAERRQEFRVKLQKRARRRAERRVEYLEDEKNWKEREVVNLRQLCWDKGASEDQIAVCKPVRRTNIYQKINTTAGLSSIASLSLLVSMSMSGLGGRPLLTRSGGGSSGTALSSLMPPYRYRRSSGSSGSRSLGPASAILERRRLSPTTPPPKQQHSPTVTTIHETATSPPRGASSQVDTLVDMSTQQAATASSTLLVPDVPVIVQSRSDNMLSFTDRTNGSFNHATSNGFLNTT